MKRIHVASLLAVLFVSAAVLLTGCLQNDYEAFAEANQKTEQIRQGVVQTDLALKLDLETHGAKEPAVNAWRDVRLSWTERFDREAMRAQHDIYLNLAGLGFDAVLHEQGDQTLLYLPGTGSYLKPFDDASADARTIQIGERSIEAADAGETFERIGKRIAALWLDTIQKDSVFRREEVLIDTPAGLVKSDRYAIEMDDELLIFSEGVFAILQEEGMLPDESTFDVSKLDVETFVVHAYVDLDGYVVKEEVELSIDGRDPVFRGLDLTLETLRYEINEDQSFQWPDVSDDELLSLDEFSQASPALFDLIDGENQ